MEGIEPLRPLNKGQHLEKLIGRPIAAAEAVGVGYVLFVGGVVTLIPLGWAQQKKG